MSSSLATVAALDARPLRCSRSGAMMAAVRSDASSSSAWTGSPAVSSAARIQVVVKLDEANACTRSLRRACRLRRGFVGTM